MLCLLLSRLSSVFHLLHLGLGSSGLASLALLASSEVCNNRLHTLKLSLKALDGFGVANKLGGSLLFIFGGIFLTFLFGRLALLFLVFCLLVDILEGLLLSCLSISNCLFLAFLDFSILDLGLFGDHLVNLSMLLGFLYDLLGFDLGVIQVTLIMFLLVLLLLLSLLFFILSLSLLLMCFFLSIMSSFLCSARSILHLSVVGLLLSLSSLFGGVILSFDCFGSHGIRGGHRSGRLLSYNCIT